MSSATIVARAMLLIRALDRYADADVSWGDYRILEGGSDPYLIIRKGSLINEFRATQRRQRTWTFPLELYRRMVGDGTEESKLDADVQEVVELFDKNPTLNGLSADVSGAQVDSGDEPVMAVDKGGGLWLLQTLSLSVKEQHTVTGGQYA